MASPRLSIPSTIRAHHHDGSTMTDELAKDVAKHLDRRRVRRRRTVLAASGALAIVAALLLRCGGGWGLGGAGGTGGTGANGRADSRPARCAIRVTAGGIFVDGKPRRRDEAVTACRPVGAEVVVTGDAREGDWKDLEAALKAANVDVVVRQR
jgi:hypothetical protein